MELCKTDTNMSLEMNGSLNNSQAEAATFQPQPQVVRVPSSAGILASNGHLKCTCLPSTNSEIDAKLENSIALAEVSVASHNSKVTFNDEIQVVPEEEEDDIIDLAEALYAAGVEPEFLESISEENFDEHLVWSEYEPAICGKNGLKKSLSEPDLSVKCLVPHPSSRPYDHSKREETSCV